MQIAVATMNYLRLAAPLTVVAAFQTPPSQPRTTALRSAYLDSFTAVASTDKANYDFDVEKAELAAHAALAALKSDGRTLDKAAEQAAWEAAWIAASVANKVANDVEKAAVKANDLADNVKSYVPPLGGRVGATLDDITTDKSKNVAPTQPYDYLSSVSAGNFDQQAAEQALLDLEKQRITEAAKSKAATGGSMDHFASTAGGFVGKDRDFKSAGGSTEASWLGAGATTAAPAAKAASGNGSIDHFASTEVEPIEQIHISLTSFLMETTRKMFTL